MDKQKALEVIEALANGIDPTTGEVFSDDSPFQNVQVTRALFFALKELKETKAKKGPANQGARWTADDDARLKTDFESGIKLKDLATQYGRSKGAIRSRLQKMGLIGYDSDELGGL